jgi:cytochrome c
MRVQALIATATALLALGQFAASAATPPAAPAPVVIKDATGASFTGDATAGQTKFTICGVCHSVKAGENKIGPTLFGIVGRKAGTGAGYTYTAANKNSGVTWTAQVLADYLENPKAKIPGTKMAYAGLKKPQDRANVIAYLATLK